jgi:hypothetical protein
LVSSPFLKPFHQEICCPPAPVFPFCPSYPVAL